MSTVKALMETSRSWSEENLFRVQTKEEIASLKKQVDELKKLEKVIEEKDAKIKEQEAEINKYRVKVYDLNKEVETLSKKRAINVKKKPRTSNTPAPRKPRKNSEDLNVALAFLAKEESKAKSENKVLKSAGSSPRATPPSSRASPKSARASPRAAVKNGKTAIAKSGKSAVKTSNLHKSVSKFPDTDEAHRPPSYEFDLESLARAVPGIMLEVALDAQKNFVAADVNCNGLLDFTELESVLPRSLLVVTPAAKKAVPELESSTENANIILIRGACQAVGLEDDVTDFNFLDSVHIIQKLKEWVAPVQLDNGRPVSIQSLPAPTSPETSPSKRRSRKIRDKPILKRDRSEVSQTCKVM